MNSEPVDVSDRIGKKREISSGVDGYLDEVASRMELCSASERSNMLETSKDYYFDSYSHFGIHEEMLKDDIRTQSYLNVIEANRDIIAGKVVMDVGCGTGILSLFCARAGAAKVIGIEASGIAVQAKEIVSANGYAEVVDIIHSRCEDVDELPDGIAQVDIIVSEWMGYFLLYECMLNTVLFCRDRWLKPDGIMLPGRAELKLVAIEDEQYRLEKFDFWDDVYGFNMTVLKDISLSEPLVDMVDEKAVISDSVQILDIDLHTCSSSDAFFSTDFKLKFTRNDTVHALASYFNCLFSNVPMPQFFSTGPGSAYTHWKQTIFYLRTPVKVEEGGHVSGTITTYQNTLNSRDLDITISTNFSATSKRKELSFTQNYRLR